MILFEELKGYSVDLCNVIPSALKKHSATLLSQPYRWFQCYFDIAPSKAQFVLLLVEISYEDLSVNGPASDVVAVYAGFYYSSTVILC
jgi:hypothetical protein